MNQTTTHALLASAALAGWLMTSDAIAQQAVPSPDVMTAGKIMEMVVSSLAQAVVIVDLCGHGDRHVWFDAIDQIDRRMAHCVAEDSTWKSLANGWEREQREAAARDAKTGLAFLAFTSFLRSRGAEARSMGAQAYCAMFPAQMLMNEREASDDEKLAYLRSNPQVSREGLDTALKFFRDLRSLATKRQWVDARCDAFWPAFGGEKR